MKKMMKVVVGAFALAMPIASNAQLATATGVSVAFAANKNTYRTGATGYGGTGGGYFASFTVNLGGGPQTFSEYLLWCIDPDRSVSTGSTYTYSVYTLSDFAASALGNKNPYHDVDLGDMKSIASLYSAASSNWGSLTTQQKKNYQGSIWSEFEGYTTYNNVGAPILAGNRSFNSRDFYVFYNGRNQTFITYISEPSSVVLLLAGMAGLMVAVRRRNTFA